MSPYPPFVTATPPPTPEPAPPPRAPASGTMGGEQTALARDLADFLIELSIALHKNSIYPRGHPLLANAVGGVSRRLNPLLQERSSLSLGVARQQLVIEGVATDANNPLLRELAGRLHRHHLGAVRFTTGVTDAELRDFLETVAVDAGRTERPLGLEPPEAMALWTNIRLLPMTFDQLELLDEKPEADDTPDDGKKPLDLRRGPTGASAGTRAAQLWIGLARAALASEIAAADDDETPSTDPVVVAKAIDEHGRDVAYDQVVVGYLLQIAQELKSKQGKEGAALQRRISSLVGTLQPETLRRLLDMGGDLTQRRRFVVDASQGMAVEAVVDLVQAAAESSQQTISHSMLRLLSKFAAHAEGGTAPARVQADGALRDHVQQLVGEWSLDDPNPEGYRKALEAMAKANPLFATSEHAYPPEPVRMVQMSLETGAVGEALWRAVDALVAQQDFSALLDLLDQAPEGHVRDAIWERVATQERLQRLLLMSPVPVALAGRLVRRMKVAAAVPLLDALESAADIEARGITDLVTLLGPEVAHVAALRLPNARWAVQRRILAALARLDECPPEFSALPYASHADPEVRREAVRILLKMPAHHDGVLSAALTDADERVVRSALSAAQNSCPPLAVSIVMRKVEDESYSPDLRLQAIRVIGSLDATDARDWLVRRALARKRWLRRQRLVPCTPELLATLAALAARWRDDEAAAPVLALAAASPDADVVAAARPPRASVVTRPIEELP